MEYSTNLDAVCCFPCCKFATTHDGDHIFTRTDFSNWKSGLEKKRGFDKYASREVEGGKNINENDEPIIVC